MNISIVRFQNYTLANTDKYSKKFISYIDNFPAVLKMSRSEFLLRLSPIDSHGVIDQLLIQECSTGYINEHYMRNRFSHFRFLNVIGIHKSMCV